MKLLQSIEIWPVLAGFATYILCTVSYRIKRVADALERRNEIEVEKLEMEEILGLENLRPIDSRSTAKSGN